MLIASVMNANNMLDWEQYVKQYVVVYQCQGAVLLPGEPREGHFEGRTSKDWLSQGRKEEEESLTQPSSASSGAGRKHSPVTPAPQK